MISTEERIEKKEKMEEMEWEIGRQEGGKQTKRQYFHKGSKSTLLVINLEHW